MTPDQKFLAGIIAVVVLAGVGAIAIMLALLSLIL
jgi:hypothetical protein